MTNLLPRVLLLGICCFGITVAWTRPTHLPRSLPARFSKLTKPRGLQAAASSPSASGLLPSMPDALKEVSESVRGAVKQAQLLPHPPVFTLPEGSLHARKVNALRIPLHPQSSAGSQMPYMLMHGLTDANITNFSTFLDKTAVRLQAAARKTVLLGCFGAGKTRLALEMLVEEFGIYLAVDDQQGWGDLPPLFNLLDNEASKKPTESNAQLLQELTECLVLSRLVVLDALLKEYPSLTAAQWVWVQKHPRSIFKDAAPLVVTLKAVWKLCREACWPDNLERANTIKLFAKALKQHMKSDHELLCVVDEPQLLLGLFDGRFPLKQGGAHSLYAPMMNQLSSLTNLVICGASGALLTHLVDEKTKGQSDAAAQDFNVIAQATPLSPQECREFISTFLETTELSSMQLDEMAELLAGRPFFVERLVSATLSRSANPLNLTNGGSADHHRKIYSVYQQLLSDQTTIAAQPVSMPLYLLNTIHGTIARAAGGSPYGSGISQLLLTQFNAAALKLWDTGEAQTLPYHLAEGLVSEGLANVVSTEQGPEVVVHELVVALAAKNFWETSASESP